MNSPKHELWPFFRKYESRAYVQFRSEFPEDFKEILGFWCVGAVLLSILGGDLSYLTGITLWICLVGVGPGCFWFIISGVYFITHATACSDAGVSISRLSWRERWVWGFFLMTLPWLPCWLLSGVRLLVKGGER